MPWSRARWPVYQRVLINLVNESAINGLLVDQRGELLVLSEATLLEAGSEPADLDGDVYVERSKILFIQAVSPPSSSIDLL